MMVEVGEQTIEVSDETRVGSLKDNFAKEGWTLVGTCPELDALIDAIQAGVSLERATRLYALYILKMCDGNKTHAAALLEVNRRTLQRWLREVM